MPDLDVNTLTDAVLAQMADTPDPRLKEIAAAAVRHLHAFAQEVNLTPAEWLKGIEFLTAVGHMCTPIRSEFILLSDVLGLSAMVNALHSKDAHDSTDTSLLGPFFRENAPKLPLGAQIVANPTTQEIVLWGQVTDGAGTPIPNAEIQVWQTNEHGAYDLQANDPSVMDMRAAFNADADGNYHFRTVRPLGYSIPMDGPVGALVHAQARHGFRPSHVHIMVTAPGHRELVTALYFGDDDHIDSDTVFGVSQSLVVQAAPDPAAPLPLPAVRFDFRLSAAEAGTTRVGADPSTISRAAE